MLSFPERTTIIRYAVKKMAAKLSRQVSCKATPAKANKEKNQRPRRGRVRGVSRGEWSRKARQTNFGNAGGRAGRGVDRGRQGNGRGEAGGSQGGGRGCPAVGASRSRLQALPQAPRGGVSPDRPPLPGAAPSGRRSRPGSVPARAQSRRYPRSARWARSARPAPG